MATKLGAGPSTPVLDTAATDPLTGTLSLWGPAQRAVRELGLVMVVAAAPITAEVSVWYVYRHGIEGLLTRCEMAPATSFVYQPDRRLLLAVGDRIRVDVVPGSPQDVATTVVIQMEVL